MLNFCPFEDDRNAKTFREIELDNLSYELIFEEGREEAGLRELQEVIGELSFINRKVDEVIKEEFLDESTRYYLEPAEEGKLSGLQQLLNRIENTNLNNSSAEDGITDDDDGFTREPSGIKKQDIVKRTRIDAFPQADGSYVFSYRLGGKGMAGNFMRAIPCCPSCHNRLPIGWLEADAFCPISLQAETGGGKSTLLRAWMSGEWAALNWVDNWTITPAHEPKDDYWYAEYMEQAKCMTEKTEGRSFCYCPDNTQTKKWVKPVFLCAEYKGKKLMVGLYDNAGEPLKSMNANDQKLRLLANMYAHIYLIEPEQMRIEQTIAAPTTPEFLTLEEQGNLQREHQGSSIVAKDLLNNSVTHGHRNSAFDMLRKYQNLLVNVKRGENIQKQHLCATIIKCDKLQNVEEIRGKRKWNYLFQRNDDENIFDMHLALEDSIKELFSEYVFSGNRELQFLKQFSSVSYHCISALGCDTEKREFTVKVRKVENGTWVEKEETLERFVLKGEFNPIRIAEPLMMCLQRKATELGW